MFYGWSWKSWSDHYLIAFETESAAKDWLNRQENDFREREIITAEKAMELAGDFFDAWDQEYKLQLSE